MYYIVWCVVCGVRLHLASRGSNCNENLSCQRLVHWQRYRTDTSIVSGCLYWAEQVWSTTSSGLCTALSFPCVCREPQVGFYDVRQRAWRAATQGGNPMAACLYHINKTWPTKSPSLPRPVRYHVAYLNDKSTPTCKLTLITVLFLPRWSQLHWKNPCYWQTARISTITHPQC